jgi:hypothetical protein
MIVSILLWFVYKQGITLNNTYSPMSPNAVVAAVEDNDLIADVDDFVRCVT